MRLSSGIVEGKLNGKMDVFQGINSDASEYISEYWIELSKLLANINTVIILNIAGKIAWIDY